MKLAKKLPVCEIDHRGTNLDFSILLQKKLIEQTASNLLLNFNLRTFDFTTLFIYSIKIKVCGLP